jgi:hypothetical protein
MNRAVRKSHAAVRLLAALLLFGAATPVLLAEHTRYWQQTSYAEFEKGTAKGVALRSDGKLLLAPQFTPLADPNVAYLWALRTDSKGNLYAAGGSSAKVLRYDPAGKVTTVFQSTELAAQALAVDAQDNLYVGTSPDGKVYKVTPAGQKSVFFEPKTKYIWDIAIDSGGTTYVATGDTGQVFAVAPDGRGELFYKSDQAHVRALAFDRKDDLIAGTEPDGLILRIPKANTPGKARQGFVLYETPNKEITSLLVDKTGNIYAASIGEKSRATPAPFVMPVPEPPRQQQQQQTSSAGGTVTLTFEGSPAEQQQAAPYTPLPSLSGSSVYKLAPDGSPEELWSSHDTLVYSLGLDASGKLLLGTGNKGVVLSLDGDHLFSSLEKTETEQVTGLVQRPGGKIYVCTANPGKVFSLGPEASAEGTFESQPFDARFFSQWGRLEWWAENSGEGTSGKARVDFYARAGNTADPDSNWSAWIGPYTASGQKVELPPARYAQWRAVLHDGSGSPLLSWVSLSYLPKNLAPQIQDVALQDPNVRVQGLPTGSFGERPSVPVHLRMPQAPGMQTNNFGLGNTGLADRGTPRFETPPQGTSQKGFQSVLWFAQDDNDDDLVYSVYYRGEGEKQWKLLKDNVHDEFYSWDTSSMADGAYYLKIVASDAPSNPPAEALEASRESDRFVVDNTPPAVTGLGAQPAGETARIHFTAKDSASAITRAEYSVDAGEWKLVEPQGRLSDSPDENYDFSVRGLSPGEHTIAVRVFDRFDNSAAAKVTLQTQPAAH